VRALVVLGVLAGGAPLWGAACGDTAADDPCLGVQCINNPPPQCEGPTKVSYSAVGTCVPVDGQPKCGYPELPRQNCESLNKLCQSGACVDPPVVPCEGVVCDSPPAPDCDGNTAVVYAMMGTCNPNVPPGGKCEYAVDATLACTGGDECRDGGCIDPTSVPCDPNPCDVPPQPTCDEGGKPSGWAVPGTCDDGTGAAVCAYAPAPLLACSAGTTCVAGTCATALQAPAAAGDLVISEIMRNPSGGDDAGEWVELYNPQGVARQLDGCALSDLGEDSYALPVSDDSPLVVGARGYFVLGRSADARDNGGFVPDHVYGGFVLANSSDEIVLTCGDVEIDRVVYTDTGWPTSSSHAMSLSNTKLSAAQNDAASSWCDAGSRFGTGSDYGTPRRPNPACP